MSDWTVEQIPTQGGRLVVITGTGGLGLQDAIALASAGAEVIVAGRNPSKGSEALGAIRKAAPAAVVSFEEVDLASLASIRAFGARMRRQRASLDGLINNAAVMAPPTRRTTADGFELQFGTNHLGPFALTAELLPLLRAGQRPRVVTVSSLAARTGRIDFDDLQAERGYRPMRVYGRSKLANLLFALELHRRSQQNGWGISSMAAHPGISATDLIANGPGENSLNAWFGKLMGPLLFQSAARGALPTLYAATSPQAVSGGYYGPNGLGEVRGAPAPAKLPKAARDESSAERLWAISEALTGASFEARAAKGAAEPLAGS